MRKEYRKEYKDGIKGINGRDRTGRTRMEDEIKGGSKEGIGSITRMEKGIKGRDGTLRTRKEEGIKGGNEEGI
jgi:hypothetical protein